MAPLATLFTWVCAFHPQSVEHVYANTLGPVFTRVLSVLSGVTYLNLGAGLEALFLLWLAWPAPRAVYHVVKRRRRIGNALICAAGRTAAAFGVVGALFYSLWGVNYARAGLIERMGWDDPYKTDSGLPSADVLEDELAGHCETLIEEVNRAYLAAFGSSDLGKPSGEGIAWTRIDGAIDDGYRRVQERIRLAPAFAESRGPAKRFISGELISTLGIAGFYFPWTAEANVNPFVPGCQLPCVMAHEKAHQRGISSEDEANFFGYLACVMSDDEYVRYSGLLFAQRQFLMTLMYFDYERAEALARKRLPGVQRDVDHMKAFWAQYEGPARTASLAMNNAYLKANRVKGGLQSYNLSVKLIAIYARQNGGSCVPSRTAEIENGRVLSGSDAAAGS